MKSEPAFVPAVIVPMAIFDLGASEAHAAIVVEMPKGKWLWISVSPPALAAATSALKALR